MKKFTNKINEEYFFQEVNVGDRVKVPLSLTTDPAKRQGQHGDVVHITKNGDAVVEFGDGGIGVYIEGSLETDSVGDLGPR